MRPITFDSILKNKSFLKENVILRAERVVDKVQPVEFFPFISIEKNMEENVSGTQSFKNIYFVTFDMETMSITS